MNYSARYLKFNFLFFVGDLDLNRKLNKVKAKLNAEHVDRNGHVSEVGYLKVANWAYWEICDRVGLLELYNLHKVSGIVFDTHMEFKKEVFEGEQVTIHLRFSISKDNRKILRQLDIYNVKNELVVKIISRGGFLDLNKRKIVEPPKQVIDICIKHLKE